MNTLLISGVIVTDNNTQCLDITIYLNSHLVLCWKWAKHGIEGGQ